MYIHCTLIGRAWSDSNHLSPSENASPLPPNGSLGVDRDDAVLRELAGYNASLSIGDESDDFLGPTFDELPWARVLATSMYIETEMLVQVWCNLLSIVSLDLGVVLLETLSMG